MEQKRPPFRFRIPWISETSRRPKKEPKSPFRPPGIAPTQPPSSSSATIEPSPPSSSTSQQGKQKMTVSRKSEQKMKSPSKITPESEQHAPRHTCEEKSTHHMGKVEKTHQEAPEEVERKMMFATSNPTGKDIKVESLKDPMTSKVTTQKPVVPNAEKSPLQKETIDDITKGIIDDLTNYVHNVSTGKTTKATDENPFNVITLAGENRGATMNVGSNPKKERSIHIQRLYKKNPDQSHKVTTDEEESSEEESSKSMKKDEARNAYVNSNIQSVNNSLMLQSSTNDRDPGVHMSLPQKPEKPVKCDDKRVLRSRNSEVNVSRNEQVSQGPRIRRRCLRGLIAEPSDSDPDNPNKPIRHGCKYKCGNV